MSATSSSIRRRLRSEGETKLSSAVFAARVQRRRQRMDVGGRANVILDNLIAQGKTKPMVVVMPLGYGAPEIVAPGTRGFAPELRKKNYDRFIQALFTEVMPQVESAYRVSKDRKERAIAGLSMGGAESLLTGLNNLDRFAWVGAFSSGGLTERL